jgi:hypothetical protein
MDNQWLDVLNELAESWEFEAAVRVGLGLGLGLGVLVSILLR